MQELKCQEGIKDAVAVTPQLFYDAVTTTDVNEFTKVYAALNEFGEGSDHKLPEVWKEAREFATQQKPGFLDFNLKRTTLESVLSPAPVVKEATPPAAETAQPPVTPVVEESEAASHAAQQEVETTSPVAETNAPAAEPVTKENPLPAEDAPAAEPKVETPVVTPATPTGPKPEANKTSAPKGRAKTDSHTGSVEGGDLAIDGIKVDFTQDLSAHGIKPGTKKHTVYCALLTGVEGWSKIAHALSCDPTYCRELYTIHCPAGLKPLIDAARATVSALPK